MCGIAGFFLKNNFTEKEKLQLNNAAMAMQLRGPDNQGLYFDKQCGLAHRRLSIIDTSAAANQPFTIAERYTIVFNGEIFNYKQLQEKYLADEKMETSSDTEVLLKLFIHYGTECFQWLQGFFALAIYDKTENKITLARDRFGKKPFLYFEDERGFFFASEMKALLQMGLKKQLDMASVAQYFQFNYLPPNESILKGGKKLKGGNFIEIINQKITTTQFYELKIDTENYQKYTYENAQSKLIELMTDAVESRMVSDVPLGAFLSGGIDSSVIVALASQFKKGLHTFSIGYKDEPFFDETKYAELVAKKYQTNHTAFKLSNDDFLNHVFDVLNYIDEPFADSSALAVYILSHHTQKYATVALSGDGADEIFAGYNKYAAEFKMRKGSWKNETVKQLSPLWQVLPKSRNHKATNLFRQLNRFAEGSKLPIAERHWRWCSWMSEDAVKQLLIADYKLQMDEELQKRKNTILQNFSSKNDFNEVLLTDMNLVLKGDMLVKVDQMSMANSLEVRSPFLDYRVVDFAFSLPAEFKINGSMKKRIVQDAFRNLLPAELYNRPKHGFEVPLLKWFRNELRSLIEDDLLSDKFILEQNLFNLQFVQQLKKQLHSNNPSDAAANIWALIVFQWWWKKYFL